MPLNFAFTILRSNQGNYQHLYQTLKSDEWAHLEGARIWGAFYGLFGLASNELVLVTMGDVSEMTSRLVNVPGVERTDTLYLEPTVRPDSYEPREKEGLYVFRFFNVENKNVNEIASLSKTAWETFENTTEYQAQPQALFCEQDRSKRFGRMLLCTWYDGLNSWQISRNPAPEARDNFQARAKLTQRTRAYATRLIT